MQLSSEFWLSLVLSLGVGLVPATLLYWRNRQLSYNIRTIAFLLRWLGSSLIALVLFLPRDPGWREEVVPKQVNIFIDNSYSMHVLNASPSAIDSFINHANKLLSVKTWLFGSAVRQERSITFTDSFTDLGSPLRVASLLKSIDSTEIVFITDGNHNYGHLDYSVLTGDVLLVVGDSLIECEIRIAEVITPTPTSMQPFIIKVIIESKNCQTKKFRLVVQGDVTHQVELETSPKGVMEIQVPVSGLPAGSYSALLKIIHADSVLDRRPLSFTVVEKKQTIALISDIIHPDIGALRRSLESFKTIETELYEGNDQLPHPLPDALIIIGLPDQISKWLELDLPYLWIMNSQTLQEIGKFDPRIQVQRAHGVRQVQGSPTTDFLSLPGDISLLKQFADILPALPPLQTSGVISTEYDKIIMWQAIEDYVLNQPLFFCTENTKCYGVAMGLWQWRFHTYRFLNTHKPFDEFVYSLLQFLISRGKIRITSSMPSYILYRFQPVVINASVIIPGKGYSTEYPVSYKIVDSVGNIVGEGFMTPSRWNYQIKLNGLTPGKYFYEVRTVVGGKTFTSSGSFTILNVIPEQIVSGRNSQFVEKWRTAGGIVIPLDKWHQALNYLTKHATETKILKPLAINWIVLAIVATMGVFLLVAEWFLRRFYGIV